MTIAPRDPVEVLRARGLRKHFDGVKALDGVDFEIESGQVLGIIGPNGSGKTTLLNVITGVVRPDEGELTLGDRSWTFLPPFKVMRMGVARTFQNIRLFEGMTVADHLEIAAINAGHGSVDDVVEALGLDQYMDRAAETLSYGLQRRVELARALAGRPAFLLLDEPAAGLNQSETELLRRDLLAIREQAGCGIALIDHDVKLIMQSSDRVLVLNEGQVISRGDPSTVRSDPAVIEAYLG